MTTTEKYEFWRSCTRVVLIAAVAIAGLSLLLEHRSHLWDFAPYLLLLACPLMHLFGHGGHGGPRGHAVTGRAAGRALPGAAAGAPTGSEIDARRAHQDVEP